MKLFNRKKNSSNSELKSLSFRKNHVKSRVAPPPAYADAHSKIGSKKPSNNKQKSSGILASWVSTSNDRRKESLPGAVPTDMPIRKYRSTPKNKNMEAVVRRVIQEQAMHSPSSTPIYRTFPSPSTNRNSTPITRQEKQQKHISRLYDISKGHVDATPIERWVSLNSATQGTNETPPGPIPLGGGANELTTAAKGVYPNTHSQPIKAIGGTIEANLTSVTKESTNLNEEAKVNDTDAGSPQQQLMSLVELFACFDCFAPKVAGQASMDNFGCGRNGCEMPRPHSIPREISFTNDSYCRDHSQLTGDGPNGFVLVDNMEELSKRDTTNNKIKPRSLLRRKLTLNRSNSSLLSKVKVYVDKPSVSGTETSSVDGSAITTPSIIQPPAFKKTKSRHAIRS